MRSNDEFACDAAESVDQPVCVVGEDARTASALAAELRLHGFRTRHFTGLALLANFLEATTPGALVIDAALLDSPRFGAVRERLHDGAVPPPVIVVSDRDDMAMRLQAVRAGGTAFHVRPFNVSVLAHRLQVLRASGRKENTSVLVIDSSDNLADSTEVLRSGGLEPSLASSPEAALAFLREHQPGLIVVNGDSRDPEATDLLLALRQYPGAYGIPALVLTAGDKRRFDARAADAGIEGVVGLPVAPQDLVGIARARMRRTSELRQTWRYQFTRDPVTGLNSSEHFQDGLRQALAIARQDQQRATLLMIRLEEADTAEGLAAVATARALQQVVPPPGLSAALSSGEFAAIVFSRDESVLEQIKRSIQDTLARAHPIAGQSCPAFEAGIGTTVLGPGIETAAEALRRARQSARIARGEADGPVPKDAPATGEVAMDQWQRDLTAALADGRFRLVYQPIASLTGQPTALYEVFVRMVDTAQNDILPQEFLPAARQLGMARHVDRWVVGRAITVLHEQRHRSDNPVLFIKLFPETVETPSFLTWLRDQLRRADTDPSHLVFQLAQRTANQQLAEARDLIRGLRELGCGIAIEHYRLDGASEPLIGKLDVDYVKLAADLSRDVARDRIIQREVESITGEARAHGVHPIAALVQDATSLSALWAAGVEYIQGYFMQEPTDIFAQEELEDHG